jgi:hypothetical protein
MGDLVFFGSSAVIGVLVCLAYLAPANLLMPKTVLPTRGALGMLILGIVFYPSVLLTEGLGEYARLPAAADLVLVVLVQCVFLAYVIRCVGSQSNERQQISLVLGLTIPIMTIGLIAQITLPIVLIADVAFALFIRKLLTKYRNNSPGEFSAATVPVPAASGSFSHTASITSQRPPWRRAGSPSFKTSES